MERITVIFDKVSEFLLGIFMIGITIALCAEVVTRYLLQISAPWISELTMIMFIWLCFLGVGIGLKRQAHVRIHLLLNYTNANIGRGIVCFADLLVVGFGVILLVYGIGYFKVNMLMTFPILDISFGWRAIVVPISGIYVSVYGICEIVKNWRLLQPCDQTSSSEKR
jgi:TRAP-type transport system small permease protein